MAEGITEEELTQAKNKVLARSVLRSERPMGRLASLGFHWTYRREYLSVDRELEAFSRVTLADLRRVLDAWPAPADDHRLRRPDRPTSTRPSDRIRPIAEGLAMSTSVRITVEQYEAMIRRGRLRAPRGAPRRADSTARSRP